MNKILKFINIFLMTAMVIHVAIAVIVHIRLEPLPSAPAWVELFLSVYYLIPLLLINSAAFLVGHIMQKKKHKNAP